LQSRNAGATFLSLWVCGIPLIYYGVLGRDWGLAGLWRMLAPLYTALCLLQFAGCTSHGRHCHSDGQ
jgi:Na+-driven multidrug efflux pump